MTQNIRNHRTTIPDSLRLVEHRESLAQLKSNSEVFLPSALKQIQDDTFVRQIDFHVELSSTNDRAIELLPDESLQTPLLVLAERQTAGRGRGSHHWWSDSGALTFSLVIGLADSNESPDFCPQVALRAGLAVAETLDALLPDCDVGLKWPNDVLLNSHKICGILVENPRPKLRRLGVGIGINVNNSLDAASDELRSLATSMCDETGQSFELADVLTDLLKRLEAELRSLSSIDDDFRQRWQSYCVLQGRLVEIQAGSKTVCGHCVGIDDAGAIVLETDRGRERFVSGVVTDGVEKKPGFS